MRADPREQMSLTVKSRGQALTWLRGAYGWGKEDVPSIAQDPHPRGPPRALNPAHPGRSPTRPTPRALGPAHPAILGPAETAANTAVLASAKSWLSRRVI